MKSGPKVSVLTVSKRTGWEHTAEQSLESQSFRDFEWVVVTEQAYSHSCFAFAKHLKAPPKTRASNLNKSLNHGLKHCKGQYVLFYQDFITLQPDAIERLLENANDHTFITTATHNGGKFDLRYTEANDVHQVPPQFWEANVALAPMKVIKELGGFDEEYDNGWSWDNCNLAERAELLGCDFLMDERVKPLLHDHEPSDVHNLNGEFHEQRMRDIKAGLYPLRLAYL
jgi:glycosyltransferase involved in cell wall biosynthesis